MISVIYTESDEAKMAVILAEKCRIKSRPPRKISI
jgi:hypothetical protein